ncbi:hypothetical protein BC936DRAFT_150104 [Jimgerdemannia flammicorona]|uniref:NAD(P)-binding protein n=1 Tax=Jimgerdemannia flammicorona TaxID=994334 RepID=A0A433CZH4_9FUNG|nr:hypothetical protein BC936DRAFT_150104 [Jimgerdemannia flammicorona]
MPPHRLAESSLLFISRLTWLSQPLRHDILINVVNAFRLITENTFRGRAWDQPCLDASIQSFRSAHPRPEGAPPPPKPWAIVTGGNTGIGYETAKSLVAAGFRVVLACRSEERARGAIERMRGELATRYGQDNELVTELDATVHFLPLDLASLPSVRAFVPLFERISLEDGLHVLVNNAGIMDVPFALTQDGYEQTVAINYLAPFLLTVLLLPCMIRTTVAPTPRIVVVSSVSAYAATRPGPLGSVAAGPEYVRFTTDTNFSQPGAYAMSKLCDLLFVRYLARRLSTSPSSSPTPRPVITINACHPWGVNTGIFRHNPSIQSLADRGRLDNFLRTPAAGATTPVYLAVSPEVEGITGQYFDDLCVMKVPRVVDDEGAQEELWRRSLTMCGMQLEEAERDLANYQDIIN